MNANGLQELTTKESRDINRVLYCHHCHEMVHTKVLGRGGLYTVFKCRRLPCGGEIQIIVQPVIGVPD
jgi:hypothetical protein